MTCNYCKKKLVNSGNSNCYVSHITRCPYSPKLLNISNSIKSCPRKVIVAIRLTDSPTKIGCTKTACSPVHQLNSNNFEFNTPNKASREDTPLKQFLLSKTQYKNNSSEHLKLIDSVINCIVKLNLPLSIVDAEPFVKLISNCNNKFRIPCRQTLSKKLIPAKAREGKQVLRDLLDTMKYCSLTCDGWTSN